MWDHLLVPLDGSALAEKALPHAVALARPLSARITLLRAVATPRDSLGSQVVDPLTWQMRKAEAGAYLEQVAERLQELDLSTETVVGEGDPAEQILDAAHSRGVDMIVVSSHGVSGLSEWNVSSVVQKVVLRAFVPLLLVRAYRQVPTDLGGLHYRRLMVALDGSQRAESVLSLATALSTSHGCQVLLVHVVIRPEVPRRAPLSEEEAHLVERLTELNRERGAEYLRDLQSRVSGEVETRLLVSHSPSAALHDLVDREDVDLILLSAHGYSGGTMWPYGSVALNFIAYGSTPLLIVQDISQAEAQPTEAEKAARESKGH